MDNKEKKNEQDMINTQVEPHNHRAIIGFDKNGVPKVLVPVSGHTHKHVDENGNEYEHSHEEVFTEDYMKAVATYRKTFPTKQDVLDNVPDPAVKEMMLCVWSDLDMIRHLTVLTNNSHSAVLD